MDAAHVVAVVHLVHAVGTALGEVLLRHLADALRREDDVVVAQHGVGAEDGEVRAGHDAEDEALLLALHGEHPCALLRVERDEVRHDRGIIHKGDPDHAVAVVDEDAVDGDAVDSCYGTDHS